MLNEHYEQKICVYCGENAEVKDHVIPVSFYYSGTRKRAYRYLTAEYVKKI